MVKRVKQSALEEKEIENTVTHLTKRFPQRISLCGPDARRFVLLNSLLLAQKCEVIKDVDSDRLVDEWIVSRLSTTVSVVDDHMKKFSLYFALSTLHKFITADICGVYLQSTKKAPWSNDKTRIRQER